MSAFITNLLLWAVPVILAITLHEVAHGYVARLFGDPTAYEAGRISLNPLRHVDKVGTLLVPGTILLINSVTGTDLPPFGWAKPVPVNFQRLRRPKADMLWVAAAGPAVNFVQAIVWVFIGRFLLEAGWSDQSAWFDLTQHGVVINLSLMLINLLPVPPLDGGRILVSLLPMRPAMLVARIEPYGFAILVLLLYFHVLDGVLWALLVLLRQFLHILSGA